MMLHLELSLQSPTDAAVAPLAHDLLGVVNPTTIPANLRRTYQVQYVHKILGLLRAYPTVTSLTLSQAWDRLPTESTLFWQLLDCEPYVTFRRKFVLPYVTELHLQELHPKLVSAFLRLFELPRLRKLDLDYDTDITDSRPDRQELLRMLVATAQPLLSRLTTFRLSFDMNCHHRATLEQLYLALTNVTCFSLHYWDKEYRCEEWWDVLRQQWELVAAYRAGGYPGLPLLPNLRRLHVSGFSIPTLRQVLALRARIGFPVREVEYQLAHILQSEYDALKRELVVFECYENVTPGPVPVPVPRQA